MKASVKCCPHYKEVNCGTSYIKVCNVGRYCFCNGNMSCYKMTKPVIK